MKSKNVLLGFISGAATGVILGILFAPDKGSITRKKIGSQGNDLTETINSKLDKVLSTFSKGAEEIGEKSTIAQINKNIIENL